MAEIGTKVYLGDVEILASGLALGDNNVQINSIKEFNTFTTQSLLFWYDSTYLATTSSWTPRIGTEGGFTATLGSYTTETVGLDANYGGVYNVTSASYINFNKTGSATQFYTGDYTAIIIGRQSGSASVQHGRLLSSQLNWLLGTYDQNPEYQSAYYFTPTTGFVILSSSIYDNNWRFYAGTRSGTTASFYQDGLFITSSYSATGNSNVFFPLSVNNGLYQNGGAFGIAERTNCQVGDVLFYSRALSDGEINEMYYILSQRYGINQQY